MSARWVALGAADGPLTGEPGVVGEVCVRAPHGKDRYDALWATERAASRNPGWHRTGDVGHLDADGRVWIEGRLAHVITAADGFVTPVGIEQRVETVDDVAAAAAVGVGPAGTQVVVVVVVPADRSGGGRSVLGARRRSAERLGLAPGGLAERVREAAGVPVAAVLVTTRLPVDIRHRSKIDRRELARRAGRVLSGTPLRRHRGRAT